MKRYILGFLPGGDHKNLEGPVYDLRIFEVTWKPANLNWVVIYLLESVINPLKTILIKKKKIRKLCNIKFLH